jgi:hypothetical protein
MPPGAGSVNTTDMVIEQAVEEIMTIAERRAYES